MPRIGLEGQERIATATVVVVGDDLTCEIVARALAAGGVGNLRLVRRTGALSPGVVAALGASNPDVVIETRPWPSARGALGDGGATGHAWLSTLSGAAVVVRSGFDDDSMLRAAVRLGVPAVVTRGRDDGVELVSFRRHGPCPHTPLNVPEQSGVPPQDGPGAVVAGHVAAAEVMVLLAGAHIGEARARKTSIPLNGSTAGEPSAADIRWTPECFACGGSGSEMSFA